MARKRVTKPSETQTLADGTVGHVKREYKIVAMRVLAEETQMYYVGRPAPTPFSACRGMMITNIMVFGSIVEVHYGNGCREDFDSAAVSVLYEPEKK